MKNRSLSKIAFAVAAALTLGACGGHHHHDSGDSQSDALTLTGGDYVTGKPYLVTAKDATALSCRNGSLSKTNPVTGEEAGDGQWYYTLPEEIIASYARDYDGVKSYTETFTVTDAEGNASEQSRTLELTDPLMADQWHLYNVAQNPFQVGKAPLIKIDIDVIPAWRTILADQKRQVDGTEVRVAVVDAPVDLKHEDLKNRLYSPEASENYINPGLGIDVIKKNSGTLHGTMVTGLIVAEGGNALGGRGIAYGADFLSVAHSTLLEAQELSYLNRLKDKGLRTVNESIGQDLVTFSIPAVAAMYEALYENGIAVFHAQGNEFWDNSMTDDDKKYSSDSLCMTLKSDCEFKQTDDKARYPYIINVAALNSLGVKASYSSTGTNLWVTGFGGEFGYDEEETETSSAAMVTTLSSFDTSEFTDPDKNQPWRNDGNRHYTSTMNGTSSATPTVTGAATLAYQAKPDMTVSQLRYLLAKTSRNDKEMATLAYEPIKEGSTVLDQGWVDNAAGFRFSNFYGFGVVDAGKLVKEALKCDEDPECKKMENLPEIYVSANENPCVYADETKLVVKCTFSDFRNEEDKDDTLQSSDLFIDALTFNVGGFDYLKDGQQTEDEAAACANLNSANVDRRIRAYFSANALLEITALSQSDTLALIKPKHTNWDFKSDVYKYDDDDDDDDDDEDMTSDAKEDFMNSIVTDSLEISTSAFYGEKLGDSAEKRYTLNISSVCRLDLDGINKAMKMKAWGYK